MQRHVAELRKSPESCQSEVYSFTQSTGLLNPARPTAAAQSEMQFLAQWVGH